MNRFLLRAALPFVIIVIAATNSVKAQNIYLWFEGIKGSSTVTWRGMPSVSGTQIMDLLSAGVTAACSTCSVSPGGAGTAKVVPGKFVFNLTDGQALIAFRKMLFKQTVATKPVCFVFRKATGSTSAGVSYYYISLGQVKVIEIDEATTTGSGVGNTFQVSLAYGQIQYTYKPQNPDGSLGAALTTSWDWLANTELSTALPIPSGL